MQMKFLTNIRHLTFVPVIAVISVSLDPEAASRKSTNISHRRRQIVVDSSEKLVFSLSSSRSVCCYDVRVRRAFIAARACDCSFMPSQGLTPLASSSRLATTHGPGAHMLTCAVSPSDSPKTLFSWSPKSL